MASFTVSVEIHEGMENAPKNDSFMAWDEDGECWRMVSWLDTYLFTKPDFYDDEYGHPITFRFWHECLPNPNELKEGQ